MRTIPRGMFDEVAAENVASFFPYIADRLDAIKEIKYTTTDVMALNAHANKMKQQGTLGKRVLNLPMHVVEEIGLAMQNKWWWTDKRLLWKIAKDSSMKGWSFVQ